MMIFHARAGMIWYGMYGRSTIWGHVRLWQTNICQQFTGRSRKSENFQNPGMFLNFSACSSLKCQKIMVTTSSMMHWRSWPTYISQEFGGRYKKLTKTRKCMNVSQSSQAAEAWIAKTSWSRPQAWCSFRILSDGFLKIWALQHGNCKIRASCTHRDSDFEQWSQKVKGKKKSCAKRDQKAFWSLQNQRKKKVSWERPKRLSSPIKKKS